MDTQYSKIANSKLRYMYLFNEFLFEYLNTYFFCIWYELIETTINEIQNINEQLKFSISVNRKIEKDLNVTLNKEFN